LEGRTQNEVFSFVPALAIEKQFSLVLEVSSSGVAFFDPTLDITEEVIRRYNAAQKK
jgi:Skp family chaperone for outer membrane proteins